MSDTTTSYYTFPSGLRLVHRLVASPVSYLGVMVGAGTRDERPEENGMAHYIEHCVFRGTQSRSSRQIINRIESVGGEINAYTTKEETTYYAAVPSPYCRRTLDLLTDMIFRSTFPKEETTKEKQVIYDEIESYNDSPSELIYDDFEALVFAGHPLAQSILGTKKTLRYFTAEKAHAFVQRTYRPDRMVVFAETDVPFARFLHMVESTVSAATAEWSLLPMVERTAPSLIPAAEQTFHRHTHQSHVMIGGRAYPTGDASQPALYFLNNILGGGSMSSLLNMSLREQKGLVYTVDSLYTPLSDTGYWSVYFASEPENKDLCLELVSRQLADLRKKPLTDAYLRRAFRQISGQMAIAAENRENSALAMAKLMLLRGVAPTWQDTLATLSRLTPDDLYRVACETFAPDNCFCLQYA